MHLNQSFVNLFLNFSKMHNQILYNLDLKFDNCDFFNNTICVYMPGDFKHKLGYLNS